MKVILDRRCAAPGCNELLVQHSNEHISSFLKRQRCGPKCSNIKYAVLVGRKCKGCRKLLHQRKTERPCEFNNRVYCRQTCMARQPSDDRLCEVCFVVLRRKPHEPNEKYGARRTHDECRGQLISRSKAHYHEIVGVKLTNAECAALTGMSASTVSKRFRSGYDLWTSEFELRSRARRGIAK